VSGRQHARRARWAIGLAIGIALALAGFSFAFERARGASSTPPLERVTPVVVATVEHRDIPIELAGVGTVEAYNQVTVKPRINGQIAELGFTEGTSVRPGQVLAKLDDRLLSAQLQQARAARLRDEASLADAIKKLARAAPLAPRVMYRARSSTPCTRRSTCSKPPWRPTGRQ
jgi:multidrug efflux system membrane fusion protein